MSDRAGRLLSIGLHPFTIDGKGQPLLAQSAEGAYLVDATGRRYVDWVMGMGSLLLGYNHPDITAAIVTQLKSGTLFSITHSLEVEVAEQLCARIPCAERVAFGKNGSDVCAASVRIARAVTEREGVLHFGYHGFHDWSAASNEDTQGVPAALRKLIYSIDYNDLQGLREILATHHDGIAALIMEPRRTELPSEGFLEGVRECTREHGVILIFDEMVTGFRLGPGGAQERFGVTPDLACVGKALSNGMALSALVGRADLMHKCRDVAYGMTARGETLALAAAQAALEVHDREPIVERASHAGESIRDSFAASCKRHGIEGRLSGHPTMMSIELPEGWLAPFLAACLARGVLSHGHLLPSSAHDAQAIRLTSDVFDESLAHCATHLLPPQVKKGDGSFCYTR